MNSLRRASRSLLTTSVAILAIGATTTAQADSQGPLSGTLPGQSTSPAQEDWSAIDAVFASDDVRASVTLTSNAETERIAPYAFGFSIPPLSTIDGIQVDIERRGVAVLGTPTTDVFLRKNDNSSVLKSDTSAWPVSDAILTLGGPSDLWGTTWNPADINGSDFGFRPQIRVRTGESDAGGFEIDHVTITVYYTPGPALAVPALPPIGLGLLALALISGGSWAATRRLAS